MKLICKHSNKPEWFIEGEYYRYQAGLIADETWTVWHAVVEGDSVVIPILLGDTETAVIATFDIVKG